MPSSPLSRGQIKASLSLLDSRRQSFVKKLSDLSSETLSYKPDSNSWSLLELLEHLVLAEEIIKSAVDKSFDSSGSWPDPSVIELIKAAIVRMVLKTPIRVKAPTDRVLPKGDQNLNSLAERWNTTGSEWHSLLLKYPEGGSSSSVFKHPISGALNLRDTIRFLIGHIDHHELQQKRILESWRAK